MSSNATDKLPLVPNIPSLCVRTLYVDDLNTLQEGIIITLCKLESIFPPAFFTVMVHLMLYLPNEAKLAGPVHTRWMYPFER